VNNGNINIQVENIAKQIIQKYKPEKIILFGSAVQGEFTADSDIDFLIIKEHAPYIGRERMRELGRLIERNVAVDFFIYRPEEFEERKRLGDPFIKAILKQGKVLYG